MSSWEQVIGQVHLSLPDVSRLLIGHWIDEVLDTISDARQGRWAFLFRRGTLTVPAVISAGTVTATNGLKTVGGVGTSWTDEKDKFFRIGTNFPPYLISDTDPVGQVLTLNRAYEDVTVAGAAYEIFKHIISLDSTVAFLDDDAIVEPRNNLPVDRVTQALLTSIDPNRTERGDVVRYVDAGENAAGLREVEIHPIPTQVNVLEYRAFIKLVRGLDTASIPQFLSESLILDGALSKGFDYPLSRFKDGQKGTKHGAKFEGGLALLRQKNSASTSDEILPPTGGLLESLPLSDD
ncbi:hypothetical protein LCGC14_2080580, partial [marine sediment metagenome]